MTVTVGALRAGLATNLATITGLRANAIQPDNPTPPQAVIFPTSITFDRTFKRGLDEYAFTITLIAGRQDARNGQAIMDGFCAPTGSGSIKTAIESDKTLGGACQTLRVTELSAYGSTSIGDTIYLTADFSVIVYA
jgi:hypothetical protein